MQDEPVKYCARCGMPIFISPVAYKGERENPNHYHHGCYNMEIRDEAIKQSSYTPRSPYWKAQEW